METTDWIPQINAELERLGVYPELEAHPIQHAPDWVAWVDTQELTVLRNPLLVHDRLVRLLEDADMDEIWQAVQSQIDEEAETAVEWSDEDGYYLAP